MPARKQLSRYVQRHYGFKGVKTRREWDRLPEKQKSRYMTYGEARALWSESRRNWTRRYAVIRETRKVSPETGRMKTYRSYRDTATGRFVSREQVRAERAKLRDEFIVHELMKRKGLTKKQASKEFKRLHKVKGIAFLIRHYGYHKIG